MPLSTGDKLGPYEILAMIGKGGMGEVYRAHDSRLNRDVAIKVSNAQFTERFTREARTIAALNHTNICHLYDVGPNYLVMEFVEGADLKGPLDFDDALPIIQQLIDGIEAAHDKNIVHRDLKPANIKITPEGVVKILDFGLAKAMELPPSGDGTPDNSPTLTMGMTQAGAILGTAAYMSPEQAKGKIADRRADVWSFGIVLYELLSGKKLFGGDSVVEILGGVLNKDPDLSAVPPRAHKLLRWCLEKDRKQRLQAIGDARRLLSESGAESPAQATSLPHKPNNMPWMAAAGVMTAVAAVAFWAPWRSTSPVDRPLVRLDVDLGAGVSLPPINNTSNLGGSSVVISPDGLRLAYASGNPRKLFTRRLDQAEATELPGTQGAVAPFFSPDSQWIGFGGSGKLNKVSVQGGAVVPLGDVGSFSGASWGEDGNIYIGSLRGLVRIPDGGGAPETVAALGSGESALTFPQILPRGKALLFSAYTSPSPDASSIEVMTLADHQRKTVSRSGTSPRYVSSSAGASGHLVYSNKSTLFAVPFDLDKLEIRGTALPVVDDVALNPTLGTAQVSFSGTGTFVYRRSEGDGGFLTVAWLDGAGRAQPLLAKPANYGRPSLSPDGQRLAVEVADASGTDIWVYDWQRDTMTRLTFTGNNLGPVWSPDGRYIVFRTLGAGMSVTRSDGAGKPQSLIQSKNVQYPWSFTADGKRMAFLEQDSKTSYDLWTVTIESGAAELKAGKPEVFLQTTADERAPVLSPDGRWLAYSSDESGTFQVYVRAFPDKGGKWQISNGGGTYPMWPRGAGHDLFFETLDGRVMAATYTVKGDSFVADKVRPWSEQQLGGAVNNTKNIDLASDGKRIVALMPAEVKGAQQVQNHVVFLENFFDELRRKVPAGK